MLSVLEDKYSFTCFSIVKFDPSITEQMVKSAMDFAKQHTDISEDEFYVIYHARKSLFSKGKAWMTPRQEVAAL